VWDPSVRLEYVFGVVQLAIGSASRAHSKVAGLSVEVNENDALVELVTAAGLAVMLVFGGVASTYRWNGEVHVDDEVLLVIKTMADRFEAMQSRLVALHPYDVPEVLAIEPIGGAAPYLAWLERETRPA